MSDESRSTTSNSYPENEELNQWVIFHYGEPHASFSNSPQLEALNADDDLTFTPTTNNRVELSSWISVVPLNQVSLSITTNIEPFFNIEDLLVGNA
ncbi:hypothetical protein OSB04_007125 [Centaurea solstitialis]|uniref:Uncharacterized protein n=1 Tax=Centaurea solstitialis TaxID=347529 RepID=A0AA38WQP8_9ASTR|nr:hypothetical protein OSB04_007125 [Centaurea solstitialis]